MSNAVTRTRSQVFSAGDATQGVTLEWTDPAAELDSGVGGVSKINHFEVYKRDANGAWVKVVDRNPTAGRGFGDYGTRVEIAAPTNASTAVGFRYRVVGTSKWITASLAKLGDSYWFDFSALSGNYEFEVLETPQGGTVEVTRTGKFVGGKDGTSSSGSAAAELVQPVVVFTRDRWGNALTQSDPRHSDWLTYFTYNRDNQVAGEKRPDAFLGTLTNNSPTRHIYFDELGRQRAVQDERGFVNTTEWDAGGNLVGEVHADGGQVTYFYDAFGQRTRMVDAVGNGKVGEANAPSSTIYREHTTRYTYDLLGHQLSTIHGDVASGAVGVWGVDEDDYHLVSNGRANLTETFSYDELGHKISSTNGAGEKTTYRYDLAGNLIETRLPGGQTSSVSYTINDDGGMTRTEIDANHNDASWTYDYFGKLIGHTDLGDAEYTYVYDSAGQLIRQTNERGQNLRYTYDAAGGLIRIEDMVSHQTTNYVLDLAGRHLRETVVMNGEVFEDNHLAYDILGRLIDSGDNRAHLTFEYDKAGNRTHVTTHVLVAEVDDPDSEIAQNGSRYFVYDEMNRQTAVDATDSYGHISSEQGHQLTYDLNGNRLTDRFWGNVVKSTTVVISHVDRETREVTYSSIPVYEKSSGYVLETYSYDALNRLETVDRDDTIVDLRSYDGAGRLVHSGPNNLPLDYAEKLNDGLPADQQIGMEVRSMRYDENGRLLFQRAWKSDGVKQKYDIDYRDRQVSEYNELTGQTTWSTVESYDAAGNVLHYKFANYDGENYNNYTNIELARYEGYVEKEQVTNSTKLDTGTSTSNYDANGYLIGVNDHTEDTLDKQMVNDAAGRVLRVTQNGNKLWTHMVNGQIMGRYGVGPNEIDPRTKLNEANFQQVADFEFGYRSISGSYPAPGVGSYTVRQGDSLQSIAQAAYGDSSQWWRIAQTNGLQSDNDLRVGQTLTLPSAISGTSNNEWTFKPYNPSDVIGDTSPNLPIPIEKGHCATLSMVIGVIVAVVVTAVITWFSYGTLAEFAPVIGAAAGDVARQYSYAAFNGKLDAHDAFTGGLERDPEKMASPDYAGEHPAGFTKNKYDYKATAISAAATYMGVVGGPTAKYLTGSILSGLDGRGGEPTPQGFMASLAEPYAGQQAGNAMGESQYGASEWQAMQAGNTPEPSVGNYISRNLVSGLSGAVAAAVVDPKHRNAQSVWVSVVGMLAQAGMSAAGAQSGSSASSPEQTREQVDASLYNDPRSDWSPETSEFFQAMANMEDPGDFDGPIVQVAEAEQTGYVSTGNRQTDDSVARFMARRADIEKGWDANASEVGLRIYGNGYNGGGSTYWKFGNSTSTGSIISHEGFMSSSSVSPVEISSYEPLEILTPVSQAELASVPEMDFQQRNDARVTAGTYDRFSSMGNALSAGRYGDFWHHLTFEASDSAKAALHDRTYVPLSREAERFNTMLSSPIGTIASLGVRTLGGSQTWQDAALLAGSFAENMVGGALGWQRTVSPEAPLSSGPSVSLRVGRGKYTGNAEAQRRDLADQAGIPRYINLSNPSGVWGLKGPDLQVYFRIRGFNSQLQPPKAGTSGKAQYYTLESHPDIKAFQFHPGAGRAHGGSYYKFDMRNGTEIKIIDPMTYNPRTIKPNTTFYDQQGNQIVYRNGQWVKE
jgi:YD repeat-containing protein